jgi:hypothetical protein
MGAGTLEFQRVKIMFQELPRLSASITQLLFNSKEVEVDFVKKTRKMMKKKGMEFKKHVNLMGQQHSLLSSLVIEENPIRSLS